MNANNDTIGINNSGSIEDPMVYVTKGHKLSRKNKNAEAEVCYRKAIALNPNLAIAHNNLGWTLQVKGDIDGAIACYRRALDIDKLQRLALTNLAVLFSKINKSKEAKPIWQTLVATYPEARELMENMIGELMGAGDLESAAEYSHEYSALCHGSKYSTYTRVNKIPVPSTPFPTPFLSVDKLRHDIAQFKYMQQIGILKDDITNIIEKYDLVLKDCNFSGYRDRSELNDEQQTLIGDTYGRIVYQKDTPRVKQALSAEWDRTNTENEYLNHPLGIVVIDDFLSEEAINSIRQFCLQSTVWFENRYSHGRLGAFFSDGFNCPLLIQIAEELRSSFPRIINKKHNNLQIWAFKNDQYQPEIEPHADFAAVNVNFWITPDDANIDKDSGGLIIYNIKAPADWDFDSYNNQGEKIVAFLNENKAESTYIPYKANRAIIFNSDLFHVTAPLQFKEEYENRRINVTLLFGKREDS